MKIKEGIVFPILSLFRRRGRMKSKGIADFYPIEGEFDPKGLPGPERPRFDPIRVPILGGGGDG